MALTNPITALRRFVARVTQPDRHPGETRYVMVPRQTSGIWVTEDTAMHLAAVFACISVISKALCSSVWEVYQEDDEGTRELRRRSQLWRLLNRRPNPEMTAFSFREVLVISALLKNGYAEIERDNAGRAIALWPLHWDRVTPERLEGELGYMVTNPRSEAAWIPARDMFHVHGPSLDGLVGIDLVRIAAQSIGHAMAADSFGAAFFGNGAQMGGVVTTEKNLGAEGRAEMAEHLNKRHAGTNEAHKLLMLDQGFKYEAMSVQPEHAQFIETRHLSIEEICRWFGVPPHKIAHLLRATNNNIEHQGLEFVRDALTPWATRLAQEAEFKLLPTANRAMMTRFDLDWQSDGDSKTRAQADSTLVQNGIVTRNEVRVRRGMNPVGPEGDKLTVQMALTTLDKVGEEPAQPVEPAEPAEPQPGEEPDDDEPQEGEEPEDDDAPAAELIPFRRTNA